MGAVAGYKIVAQAGSATSVSVSAEACTSLSATIYRVTNSLRRVLDPAHTPVVKDGGVTVSAALYSVNYLTGTVTFSGYTVLGSITIDAYYVPMATIAEVQSIDFGVVQQLNEITPFDATGAGARTFKAGLVGATLNIGGTLMPWVDLGGDVVGGVTTYFTESTPRAWRMYFYDGSNYFVAVMWGTVKEHKESSAVDGVIKMALTLEANARSGKSVAFDSW